MSVNWNLDNFQVPENAPFDLNLRIYSQPIPIDKSTLGFLTPNKIDCVAPLNQIFSTFLFFVLYSLSYKSVLLSASFCSSSKEDFPFLEVLDKVYVYYLSCLL